MSQLQIEPGKAPLKMSADEALNLFDGLAPCTEDKLRGRWSGREVHTGHPLDRVLTSISWYGKQFDGPDQVHPLLVIGGNGRTFPLNPNLVPMRMITAPVRPPRWASKTAPTSMSLLRGAVRARRYGASLSMIEYRGVRTAAMIYAGKPITDVFRAIDDDTVLGLMDYTGMPRPYFFILHRDG